MTPDVENLAHRVVTDRADVDAGPAGGARPDGFGRDGKLEQALAARLAARQAAAFLVEEVALVDLQGGWRQDLARSIGRTRFLAAIAHDAGVGVHQGGPGELLQARGAELLDGGIIEVQSVELTHRPARSEEHTSELQSHLNLRFPLPL